MNRIRLMFLLLLSLLTAGAALSAPVEVADSVSYDDYQQLDEFVIEVEKPVVQSNGAVTTYNVDEDPTASSSTALEILKKVPMVTVDGDGKVRLNGSTNFKFQVNGLENPMLAQYADKILQGLPASAVVKIEVITQPGAKEDAEGGAGIINIITERSRQDDGFSGSLSARASTRDVGPSLNAIVKKDKVTLSAGFNYVWGFGKQKGEQDSEIRYLNDSHLGSLISRMSQESTFSYLGGNLDLSWEPNEKNLFTFGTNIMNVSAKLDNINAHIQGFSNSNSLLWQYGQRGNGSMDVFSISANASYRHNFAPEGNYLILSYLFNFGKTDLDLLQKAEIEDAPQIVMPYENSRSKNFNRGHTVQIDYANDFKSEHHLMEIGAKGIFRHNNAAASYLYDSDSEGSLSRRDDSYVAQPQDIYAAYASYTGKYGVFSVTGGLRYEHTRMGITDFSNRNRSFINHLNDWVPNVAATWNMSNVRNLRASYQMRISRPSIDQVNPFELSLSPFEIRTGNQHLDSERNHILTLSYSDFGRIFGGNIGIEYQLADNAISSYSYLLSDAGYDIVYTSYGNIGRKQSVALTGFGMLNITNHMNLSLNGRVAYNSLRSYGPNYSSTGWSGNIGGSWNYTVADVNKFTAYGGWNSRNITLQGHSSGWYYYGLGASHDFLKDRSLTLGVNAYNFFGKSMTFKSYVKTHDSESFSVGKNLTAWSVSVSLTWKFGSLNTRVKSTGATLSNDDINSSSNKSSTSTF